MSIKKTLLATSLLGLLALPGEAGNGTITTKDGKRYLNLTVYFQNTSLADIERWKTNFRQANAILYRSTLGQLQFGDIRYGRDSFTKSRADIVIPPTGHAHVTGEDKGTNLGTKETLFLYNEDDVELPLVTVHELGHYVFGVWDEYKGGRFGIRNGAYQLLGETTSDGKQSICVRPGDTSLASIM